MKQLFGVMLTAVLLISPAAMAQDGSPGGFPGGPGRSGFGPPAGGPGAAVEMLGIQEVQAELKLSEDQKKTITEISQEMRQSMRDVFEGRAPAAEDAPPAEGGNRFEQIIRQIEGVVAKSEGKIHAVLNDDQNKRYSQLRLQREGSAALIQDETAKQLKLSEAQRQKLQGTLAGSNPFLSPEERDRMNNAAVEALTEEQRTRLAELKGPAFTFPEIGFGGPGDGPPGGGFGGFPGGPRGMGGPGGMIGQSRKLVAEFDKDGNGWLNKAERTAARESIQTNGGGRRGGFGPPGGFGGREEPASPGPKVAPEDVSKTDAPLYDANTVRTLFLNFEDSDWETELEAFNNTDVEVPATLIVDGTKYEDVGVHFRGMSSFGAVSAGHKRSLNLSLDFLNEDQRVGGYKTLNLLNSHEDPSFLHTVLYFDVARNYLPAPKANFVRVVINGESWGLYVSAQQFNKEFVQDNFGSSKGARWKVPGSPGGRGGLEYLGEDVSAYEGIYSIRSSDDKKAWKKLIELCKTLNETPTDQLEEALKPILDIDGALWFLALENALINSDGYWVRASDYCIFLDGDNKFHIIPHDANETFQPGMGGRGPGGPGMGGPGMGGPGMGRGGFGGGRGERPPVEGEPEVNRPAPGGPGGGPPRDGERASGAGGFRGGPGGFGGGRGPGGPGGGTGGNGVTLDPLIGLDDNTKPLRSKLLAVPALRQRYLSFVKTIAEDWLDWKKLSPIVDRYAALIGPHIEADTRKLSSYDAFLAAVSAEAQPSSAGQPVEGGPGGGPGFGRQRLSLRQFVDQRRAFLLEHPEVKAAVRVDYERPKVKAKSDQEKSGKGTSEKEKSE